MTPVSAVLFDLYGTLLTYGNMREAFALWHRDLAIAIGEAGGRVGIQTVARNCEHFFSQSITGDLKYTAYEERLFLLAKECGITPTLEWIKKTAATSMDNWQSKISLNPEAIPVLQALRAQGIRTGVISNFDHHPHVYKVLHQTGIFHELDAIIISGEVRLKKPDPQIFFFALEKLNTTATKTLFVGDDPDKDICGAQAIGMQTRLFQNGASLSEILSPLEVS
jgi:putative hydrolase of the HAD superfamily